MLRNTAKPSTSSAIHNLPDFIGEFVEHWNHVSPFIGEGGAGACFTQRRSDGGRLRYGGGEWLKIRVLERGLVSDLLGRAVMLVNVAMPRDEHMRQPPRRPHAAIGRKFAAPKILAESGETVSRKEIRNGRDDHEIGEMDAGFSDRRNSRGAIDQHKVEVHVRPAQFRVEDTHQVADNRVQAKILACELVHDVPLQEAELRARCEQRYVELLTGMGNAAGLAANAISKAVLTTAQQIVIEEAVERAAVRNQLGQLLIAR